MRRNRSFVPAPTQVSCASFDDWPAPLASRVTAAGAAAHAALESARAVFVRSEAGVTDALAQAAPSARATALWDSAEWVLRLVTQRDDLRGQAVIREASAQQRLRLDDAHALVALRGWREQFLFEPPDSSSAETPPSTTERAVTAAAYGALVHAVSTIDAVAGATRPADTPVSAATTWRTIAGVPEATTPEPAGVPRSTRRRRSMMVHGTAALLLAGGGVAAWYAVTSGQPTALSEGVAAYARGSRETARIAFARAAREQPRDVTPLIFLGRIAREDGNIAASRRFLDAAVRLSPSSALANRELASSILADGDAEVARRFYVRALQADPSDRLSQGFLGCALSRLGRAEEARRWLDRAGPGDWTACVVEPARSAPSRAR